MALALIPLPQTQQPRDYYPYREGQPVSHRNLGGVYRIVAFDGGKAVVHPIDRVSLDPIGDLTDISVGELCYPSCHLGRF